MFSSEEICNAITRASCCFSEMTMKLIEAKAYGDIEQIKCFRRKLMTLDMIIFSMGKYYPVIEEGFDEEQELVITHLNVNDPLTILPIYANGVRVSDAQTGDTLEIVANRIAQNINSRISDRDDEIQVVATVQPDFSIQLNIRYNALLKPQTANNISLTAQTDNATVQFNAITPYSASDKSVKCLTENDIRSLIEKFSKYCGCGCSDSFFNDTVPNILN